MAISHLFSGSNNEEYCSAAEQAERDFKSRVVDWTTNLLAVSSYIYYVAQVFQSNLLDIVRCLGGMSFLLGRKFL